MPDVPTGTVTFLFTDIEGSTPLLRRVGDVLFVDVLAVHRQLLRSVIDRNNGHEIDAHADGFLAVFRSARNAVSAAVEAQRRFAAQPWPGGAPVRVRIGLHTGESVVTGDGYVGMDVHRAARICEAAHGGEILISQATRGVVEHDLPHGTTIRDLGEHRLKGLLEPEHLFQVVHPDLWDEFPEPRASDAPPNNLPAATSSFVGRQREIQEVARLLTTTRLLTLTGPGGCGKTRLALQAAAMTSGRFPDGIWLIQLGSLTDPALVSQTAASALGVAEKPVSPLIVTLADFLRYRGVLLVLDSCEHLVAACAEFAEALLTRLPNLRLLATSQEALGVPGETVWHVPPLATPDPQLLPPLEALARYEAVELFLQRAAAVRPGFRLTSKNAPAVAEICHRLDGIPLAIELAAARVKVLPVQDIATRLGDSFRLLTGGSRTTLPRYQTLREAMNWSYQLLEAPERLLFQRLSVFIGGWTLEEAEAVCAGNGLNEADTLRFLSQLVDKSLVIMEEVRPGMARYRLLETVRQYGEEKLRESGTIVERNARRRAAEFFVVLAEQAQPQFWGAEQELWFDRLEVEHDNLRAILNWCLDHAVDAGLRLGGALWRFWEVRGHLSEGRQWLERLLGVERETRAPKAVRAKVLTGAGVLARAQGDYRRARGFHEEALALCRELGDKRAIAVSLNNLGVVAKEQGDYEEATALHEAALALRREVGDRSGIASSLNNLGVIAQEHGEQERAWDRYEQSLMLLRQLHDSHGVAAVLNNMANVAFAKGDYAQAQRLHEESLALSRELGNRRGTAISLTNLSALALRQGRLDDAMRCNAGALALQRDLGDREGVASCLEGLAGVACARGQFDRAGRLFSAAEALRGTIGAPLPPIDRQDHDRRLAAVRAGLGEAACATAWAAGRTMRFDEAIAYALGAAETATAAPEGVHREVPRDAGSRTDEVDQAAMRPQVIHTDGPGDRPH